jgi:FkbM family methyltransferase
MYNNTYLFYEKGSSGVNVEPDPGYFTKLASQRPRDVNLNVGVGSHRGTFNYYVMTSRSLNTFSEAEAKRYESYGKQKIEQVVKVEVVNVNEILRDYFEPEPNFVSLDVEGLEMEILKSFDFEASRPEVFCIETLIYTEDNTEVKVTDIIEYMKEMDYIVHSDTYINTIFVDRASWLKRGNKS